MTPFMPSARCGVQWKGYCPGLIFPKETVTDSPLLVFKELESSPILSEPMFASSCGFTSGGIVAGSNATLCGPPLRTTNLMASPCLTVMLAGSKRDPFASPTILTVLVVPVTGAAATAPVVPAVVDAAPPAVVVVVVVAALVSTATCVVSEGCFSPPAHAPSEIIPAATANP